MTQRAALARPAAIVTSATVDVQVLRIGAKQMTLAVFRQLHRDDSLDGPMWGTVNYCHRLFGWPCDPQEPEHHQHIVWQDGNDLRHAMRRTLEGIGSEHSRRCFDLARRWYSEYRRISEQALVDHAATFTMYELTAIERALAKSYGHWDHDGLVRAFLEEPPGTWRERYPELERAEARFETLPQLFIAV